MKYLYPPFTLLLLVMSSFTSLQSQWVRQYPMAKLEDVLDIDISPGGYGFAVGTNDLMLRFNSENRNWDLLPGFGEEWRFESVDYLEGSGGNVAAAGGTGLILTLDKGENWDEVPGAPAAIHAVKLFSPTHMIVVGDEGAYKFENDEWTDLNDAAPVTIRGAFILDEQHIWVYTWNTAPAIYYTTNGGDTWNTNTDIEDIDLVRFFDTMNGIATNGRKVYNTVNGGVNWTLVSTDIIHSKSNDMTFGSSPDILIAATLNADPTMSTDGGLTWTKFDTDLIYQRSYSIAVLSDTEFWLGNDLSGIALTEDAGDTWVETSGPTRNIIQDVFFVTRTLGFATGLEGMLLRTMDGGSNWENISFGTRNYLAIHGLSEDDLWIATNQRILHSVDTGATWTEALVVGGSNMNDILAISPDRILVGSTSGIIYRSNNGGMTWDTVYNAGNQIKSIARIDDQRYMATGFSDIIIRSEDQGETWQPIAVPEVGLAYEQAFFLDTTGWLVTSNFKKTMWKTTNAGDTWTPITLPIERTWDGVFFISPDTGIVVGRATTEGRVYVTYTGGQTWTAGYITPFPFSGVTGIPHPNGRAWIYGYGSDIEVLPFCTALPGISDFTGDFFPCELDTVSFNVSSENIDTYHWFLPSDWQILGNPNNDTIQVIVGQNSGTITVSGSNVCGSSGQLSKSAGPSLLPSIFNLSGDLEPCAGETVAYNLIHLNVDTFEWTLPSDWQFIGDHDTEDILVFVGHDPGFIAVTGSNHCGSDEFVFQIDPFTIPNVGLQVNGDLLSLTADASAYQWYLNGTIIPGATDATYDISVSGFYHAELFFAEGCSTTSDTLQVIASATHSPPIESIEVYPVPADDLLHLNGIDGDFTYMITDLTGRMMDKENGKDKKITIDRLPAGFYLLNISSDGSRYRAKFVRE